MRFVKEEGKFRFFKVARFREHFVNFGKHPEKESSVKKRMLEKFLEVRKDFCLEPLPLPEKFPKNETGMLALFPGQYDTDGFFIARLERNHG